MAKLLGLLVSVSVAACADDPCSRGDEAIVIADMPNALGYRDRVPVRGRLVEEELPFDSGQSVPLKEVSQKELEAMTLTIQVVDNEGNVLASEDTEIDEEGYFDVALRVADDAPRGRQRVEVLCGDRSLGTASVQLVGGVDFAVRSDVDLTYLDTRFHTGAELRTLMTQPATEKTTLPGMDLVYRHLRRGVGGTHDRSLSFISGSPTWFKRVLEEKARLDGVEQDGLVLKFVPGIVASSLLRLDFDSVVSDLKNQIGYKLSTLLYLRLALPPDMPEVLLGDDSESDVVAYVLYHRYLGGELTADALDAELVRFGVSREFRNEIALRGPAAARHVLNRSPVRAIYINTTDFPSETHRLADWMVPNLVRPHRGALPLIEDLAAEGWVEPSAVEEVRARLLGG